MSQIKSNPDLGLDLTSGTNLVKEDMNGIFPFIKEASKHGLAMMKQMPRAWIY